jgi:oligopeptide/dipeptide ABC transporter ATP-binding protein
MPDGARESLLRLRNLRKYFPVESSFFFRKSSLVRAVDDVSFEIFWGETFALVGESGCGKTTIGKMVLRLIKPTGGEIHFHSKDLERYSVQELNILRQRMQIIFQDPYSSLNPRKTIRTIIEAPLIAQGGMDRRTRRERLLDIVEKVGLDEKALNRYPHEFSGGQRQRIVIARALILRPELVICDEPVSALDVSIQSQILNLLKALQRDLRITYLFISHDLRVVKYISDRIAVMYLGKLCEVADTEHFYADPRHPYSQALLSVIPEPDPRKTRERKRIILEGEIPNPSNPPPGCYFHTRCIFAKEKCREVSPELRDIARSGEPEHLCACHLAESLS